MKSNLAENLRAIKIIVPNEKAKIALKLESKNLYETKEFNNYKTLAHLHLLPDECWLTTKEVDEMFKY